MSKVRNLLLAVFILLSCAGSGENDPADTQALESGQIIYPGTSWLVSAPEEQGFTQAVIDSIGAIMKKNNANGVLIRNGKIVGEWLFGGEANKKFDTQSVSKSITSLTLGLAIRDGWIKSLDDYVVNYYQSFDCGEYSDSITFRHLVTNTSGIALTRWTHQRNPGWMKPGLENHYHNDHWTELARALTYIYGKPLKQVMEEQVLPVIGAEMDWWKDGTIGGYVESADGDSIEVNAGYAFSCWSARDLARVGYLYLNGGKWDGQQVLPQDYVKASWTEIPQPIGGRRPDSTRVESRQAPGYGLGWWTSKDSGIWSMLGNGGQFCTVIPRYNIVFTKVNDYRIERPQQLSAVVFLPLILEAMGEDISAYTEAMDRRRRRAGNSQNQFPCRF